MIRFSAGLILLTLAWTSEVAAQSCECTVWQVRSNAVAPCALIVGEVVTANTVDELRSAITRANAGNGNITILIGNGVYRIASTSSFPYITASNVVFRSASGHRDSVIIEGGGMRDVAPETENGFLIAGDHVAIADLTIRNVGNHGIQVSGHHLFVHNVRIQDTREQMLKGATVHERIDSAIVQCSMFEYTAGVGPQYYIGGLDIHKGRGWIVRDNVFTGIQSPSGSVAEHAIHFWNNSSDNIIERNLILNCDRGIGFGLGSSANNGGIIRNNMIFNDGSGSFADVGIGLESSPGTKVYHNSVYLHDGNAVEYRFPETRDVEIVNNLTNRPIRSRDGGAATLAANVTSAMQSHFIGAAVGDLHLAMSVEGIVDAGSALPVLDDIDRNPRPAGAAPDIGAHEYSAPAGVMTAPQMKNITIFPNPGSGRLTISADADSFILDVHDLLGTKVYSAYVVNGTHTMDIAQCAKGLYLCIFSLNGIVHERRYIILQ